MLLERRFINLSEIVTDFLTEFKELWFLVGLLAATEPP